MILTINNHTGILRVNEEKIMEAKDDGVFIDILKEYCASLGEAVEQDFVTKKSAPSRTKFNQLVIFAYSEFADISDESIMEYRRTFQLKIVHGIETFTKRSTVRNLTDTAGFSKEELFGIYDHFQTALFYQKKRQSESSESALDFDSFSFFLGSLLDWARIKNGEVELQTKLVQVSSNADGSIQTTASKTTTGTSQSHNKNVTMMRRMPKVDIFDLLFHEFIKIAENAPMSPAAGRNSPARLKSPGWQNPTLNFQDVVTALGKICHDNLLSTIEMWFRMHDADGDGFLSKEEIVKFSENMLFIFRVGKSDEHLASISNFLKNAHDFLGSQSEEQAEQLSSCVHQMNRWENICHWHHFA